MNPPTDGVREFSVDAQTIAPPPMTETRPFYWSVRRELWENRSVYLAPLIVAAVVLFGTMIGTIGLAKRMRNASSLDPGKRHVTIVKPYSLAPAPIMFATFVVGLFYSLDALYGERRDRSILFWKSLPVSDVTTVLSKAAIPLAVLPFIAFVLGVAAQLFLLFQSTVVLLANGISPAPLWAEFHYPQEPLVMIYGLTVHVLWFAPIYALLLLVSAWARRLPMLWVVLPILTMLAVERIAFRTSYFGQFLKYRFIGAMTEAFAMEGQNAGIIDRVSQLTPGRFLSSPGLWIGLIFAGAFLAAAVRLRRNREPI